MWNRNCAYLQNKNCFIKCLRMNIAQSLICPGNKKPMKYNVLRTIFRLLRFRKYSYFLRVKWIFLFLIIYLLKKPLLDNWRVHSMVNIMSKRNLEVIKLLWNCLPFVTYVLQNAPLLFSPFSRWLLKSCLVWKPFRHLW